MKRAIIALCASLCLSTFALGQDAAKPTQETYPAGPRPAELTYNFNPDSQFYQLAAGSRVENNAVSNWTLNTMGFREVRLVLFMTDAKKDNRVSGSSVIVTAVVRDGDQEFEASETEIPISVGRASGKAWVQAVYSPLTTLRVTPKNVSGSLHLSAYVVK